MGNIDNYLKRATTALQSDCTIEIEVLVKEIVSVFSTEIPHLSNFRGMQINTSSSCKSSSSDDLRKLIGKLCVLREKQDRELFGEYGFTSITASIRQLEDAQMESKSENELKNIYKRIDHIYANVYDSYTDGLCGYLFNDDPPSYEQTQLRIEKLRHFRDEEYKKQRLAEAQQMSVSVHQEALASASNTIEISVSQVNERIDEIPEHSLSEEDKNELKGMIMALQTSDNEKRESRLHKLLSWISNKGTDVFIAAMPYVVQVIQSEIV